MTTSLQTRIAAIKAECEEIIRLDKLASDSPWGVNKFDDIICDVGIVAETFIDSPKTISGVVSNNNARFIAHSRNVSPAMARVVIAWIKDVESDGYDMILDYIADQWEGK